jgi:hypothetical protein
MKCKPAKRKRQNWKARYLKLHAEAQKEITLWIKTAKTHERMFVEADQFLGKAQEEVKILHGEIAKQVCEIRDLEADILRQQQELVKLRGPIQERVSA